MCFVSNGSGIDGNSIYVVMLLHTLYKITDNDMLFLFYQFFNTDDGSNVLPDSKTFENVSMFCLQTFFFVTKTQNV